MTTGQSARKREPAAAGAAHNPAGHLRGRNDGRADNRRGHARRSSGGPVASKSQRRPSSKRRRWRKRNSPSPRRRFWPNPSANTFGRGRSGSAAARAAWCRCRRPRADRDLLPDRAVDVPRPPGTWSTCSCRPRRSSCLPRPRSTRCCSPRSTSRSAPSPASAALSIAELIAPPVNLVWWLGIAGGLFVCPAIGVLQGSLITRLHLPSFIVTLGGLLGLTGVFIELAHDRQDGGRRRHLDQHHQPGLQPGQREHEHRRSAGSS